MKKLICNEVFTHALSCILPSFSQNVSQLLRPKRLGKSQFLSAESGILVICLLNHLLMLKMTIDVLLSAVFVK